MGTKVLLDVKYYMIECNEYIIFISAAPELDHDHQDKIELVRGGEDSILGGALCSGTPVLFTKSVGLVSITPTDFATQDFTCVALLL